MTSLRGIPNEIDSATALRTPELLDRLEADLTRAIESSRSLSAAERARLPEVLAALRAIDDAGWWIRNRKHMPPHTSKRAYEDYPWPLWKALQLEAERARERSELGREGACEFSPCPVDDHAALEPELPDELMTALRKGGHRRFLLANDRVVAIHNGGVRFIGAKGKPTARGVPKGSGQVEGSAIADDGSFVLLRNAGGLHRVGLPDKSLATWPTPPRTMHSGLCSLMHGRFAMVRESPALAVYELREGELELLTEATHPELDSYASLDRIAASSGELDLIVVRSKAPSGERITLLAGYDGATLTWIARHPLSLFAPRRAPDGSIVLLAGRDSAVRLRV